MYYTVLYGTVLYCAVLYCSVLYYYCAVLVHCMCKDRLVLILMSHRSIHFRGVAVCCCLCQRVLSFALCYFILRDMGLCQACGMPLTGANVAAIEAATAAGPSYAYTDTRSSLLNFGRWRR